MLYTNPHGSPLTPDCWLPHMFPLSGLSLRVTLRGICTFFVSVPPCTPSPSSFPRRSRSDHSPALRPTLSFFFPPTRAAPSTCRVFSRVRSARVYFYAPYRACGIPYHPIFFPDCVPLAAWDGSIGIPYFRTLLPACGRTGPGCHVVLTPSHSRFFHPPLSCFFFGF